jgi:hypothetical protein
LNSAEGCCSPVAPPLLPSRGGVAGPPCTAALGDWRLCPLPSNLLLALLFLALPFLVVACAIARFLLGLSLPRLCDDVEPSIIVGTTPCITAPMMSIALYAELKDKARSLPSILARTITCCHCPWCSRWLFSDVDANGCKGGCRNLLRLRCRC